MLLPPHDDRSPAFPARGGPVFVDSIGADLLTAIASASSAIRERHDTLEFVSEAVLRHEVVVTVSLERAGSAFDTMAVARSFGDQRAPLALVPLATLDRHGRGAPHVRDEAGRIVPLVTSTEVQQLLGGGLVAFASRVIEALDAPEDEQREMSIELELFLRRLPTAAAQRFNQRDPDIENLSIEDATFHEVVQVGLLELDLGFDLLKHVEFMHAARMVCTVMPLVVALDPSDGQTRVLTLVFERPLLTRPASLRSDANEARGDGVGAADGVGRLRRWATTRQRRMAGLRRLWRRAGTLDIYIPVGVIGDCDRYVLEATAPLDTYFGEARMTRVSSRQSTSSLANVTRRSRLTFEVSNPPPTVGILTLNLRVSPFGLARVALFGARLTVFVLTAGFAWVWLSADHAFFPSDAGTGSSPLLLAPALATIVLAGPAHHRLAATMQYPLRLLIWGLGALCFSVAVAAALRLDGTANLLLWAGCASAAGGCAIYLGSRFSEIAGHRDDRSAGGMGQRT